MAVSADVRRMIFGTLVFMLIGVVFSLKRGDSPLTIAGYAVVGAFGAGFVIACYVWARRKKN